MYKFLGSFASLELDTCVKGIVMSEENIRAILIKWARKKYGEIYPCGNSTDFENSFTFHGKKTLFWFNDQSSSTRLLMYSPNEDGFGGVIQAKPRRRVKIKVN